MGSKSRDASGQENAHPSSKKRRITLVRFRPPYTSLRRLFVFAQFLLNFPSSELQITAASSFASRNKCMVGHRPPILQNEAKWRCKLSLLAPLLEYMFAFAQLSFDFQYSGFKMTVRRRCTSSDKYLEGNGRLNGENEMKHVGVFSPMASRSGMCSCLLKYPSIFNAAASKERHR